MLNIFSLEGSLPPNPPQVPSSGLGEITLRFEYQHIIFLVNDALDDILADSDDESEEQAVIDKVLDEIGIEITGKVNIWAGF